MVIFSIVIALGVCGNAKWSLYHVPWACSVVYQSGDLISACAIFDETKVLVSVDNFNHIAGRKKYYTWKKYYYQVVQKAWVYAGSNLMDPERDKYGPDTAQGRRASTLYVLSPSKDSYVSSPMEDLSQVDHDIYGTAYNIGILEVKIPFVWSSVTQPIIVPSGISNKTRDFLMEAEKVTPKNTCITYSWSQETNRIRYHEVRYLPMINCLDVFCLWNVTVCHLFPTKPYHVCFKSVKYVDVCPSGRGAALYCPGFHNAVFAILTSAPSCGQSHLPGVYTTLSLTIGFYEKIYNTKFDVDKRPKYDPLGLDQQYSRWG